jgi:hypothetical protein
MAWLDFGVERPVKGRAAWQRGLSPPLELRRTTAALVKVVMVRRKEPCDPARRLIERYRSSRPKYMWSPVSASGEGDDEARRKRAGHAKAAADFLMTR